MFRHFCVFGSVTVSWYCEFHIQVCVIAHIGSKCIVGLRQFRVTHYAVKLLLEFWVILQVLSPVFRVRLCSIISEFVSVLFLESSTDFGIEFLDSCFHFFSLLFEVRDPLNCRARYNCRVLGQYPIRHETTDSVRHSKPPSDSCCPKSGVLLVRHMVVETKV